LRNSKNSEFVDAVSEKNVLITIENIRERSRVLADMEEKGEVLIVGAMYDISTGAVDFY